MYTCENYVDHHSLSSFCCHVDKLLCMVAYYGHVPLIRWLCELQDLSLSEKCYNLSDYYVDLSENNNHK